MNEAEFDQQCDLLRRNDPSIGYVGVELMEYENDRPQRYGHRLGEALMDNECVTSISLDIDSIVDSNLIRTTDSDNSSGHSPSPVSLMRYLQTSRALQSLVLQRSYWSSNNDHVEVIDDLVGLAMDAVAQSSSITKLDIRLNAPYHQLAHLLEQTTSITDLTVTLFGAEHRTGRSLCSASSQNHQLAQAFGANQTLESLSLNSTEPNANDVIEAILQQLSHHSLLRNLTLETGLDADLRHFQALAEYLKATKTLQHLSLWRYVFNEESTLLVCEAIQSNAGLDKLTLHGCHFNVAATSILISFLQDRIRRDRTTCHAPLVHELVIRLTWRHEVSFAETTVATVAAQMLRSSSLETLHLSDSFGRSTNVVAFFNDLVHHAAYIGLVKLVLDELRRPASVVALAQWLPTTSTLHHLMVLEVHQVETRSSRQGLLSAIRQNGSLCHVDLVDFFDDGMSSRLETYLERNQNVPLLLSRPELDQSENRRDTDSDHTRKACSMQDHGGDEKQTAPRTSVRLFPRLFAVAQHAPRTAPNAVLIGLLAISSMNHKRPGASDACTDIFDGRDPARVKRPRLLR